MSGVRQLRTRLRSNELRRAKLSAEDRGLRKKRGVGEASRILDFRIEIKNPASRKRGGVLFYYIRSCDRRWRVFQDWLPLSSASMPAPVLTSASFLCLGRFLTLCSIFRACPIAPICFLKTSFKGPLPRRYLDPLLAR